MKYRESHREPGCATSVSAEVKDGAVVMENGREESAFVCPQRQDAHLGAPGWVAGWPTRR